MITHVLRRSLTVSAQVCAPSFRRCLLTEVPQVPAEEWPCNFHLALADSFGSPPVHVQGHCPLFRTNAYSGSPSDVPATFTGRTDLAQELRARFKRFMGLGSPPAFREDVWGSKRGLKTRDSDTHLRADTAMRRLVRSCSRSAFSLW